MYKPVSQHFMENHDKIEKIKSWINKNGYPFEMQVAKSFRKAGFEISQSILYKDSETEKYREADLIAHITKEINNVWLNITFVVECKKTIDKPWIIFSNKELYTVQNNKYPILASTNATYLIKHIAKNNSFQSPLIFPKIINSGYNIVTAFSEKSDIAYSASQSVIKACEYLVTNSNKSNKRFCNIYIPIIAIEGELHEAFLNNQDEIELTQVDWSTVVSTKSFDEQNSNLITIVSSSHLDKFTAELKQQSIDFFEKYSVEIDLVLNNYPTNKH